LGNKKTKIPFLVIDSGMFVKFRPILALLFIVLFNSCKNSDSWLAKQWHNTTAHYNMFFNAEQKWLETVAGQKDGFKDDFRKYMELYNYGSGDALKANLGVMDEIVKQSSTMIDRHPKSKWVDDAYLLTGKSYFMKGDFIAAQTLFEYVNSNFKSPIMKYRAQLWIYQCLVYQNKLGEAESLATTLKNDKEFPKQLQFELQKSLANIYLKQGKIAQCIEPMEKALERAHGKMEKYRLHYALGQAYQNLKKYDQAESHFAKVVKMNPPYEIAFNARINQVELLSFQNKNYQKANSILKRMLKDDKNIEYYGQIYYRMGRNELRAGYIANGVALLNKSIRNSKNDQSQITTSYLALGDLYFEKRNFEKAGLYYDSANKNLDEKHPDYATIAKRSIVLGDLLKHLVIIKTQDSLLKLAKDPVLREKTIDHLIELEKRAAAAAKEKPTPSGPAPGLLPDPGIGAPAGGSSFPFYNPALKSRSLLEFQTIYGTNRVNRDYWRINAKKSAVAGGKIDPKDTAAENPDLPKGISADRKKYYEDIPLTKEAQAEANIKIEDALFATAGVYQNSLNEPNDAIKYYQDLLSRYPATKYEAQVLYELAKLYKAQNNLEQFEVKRNELKSKFPESIYVKLLDNNGDGTKIVAEPTAAAKEIEDLYAKMYDQYKKADYKWAMETKLEADRKYSGNVIQARFDYLYALCMIKGGDQAKGIELLKQIMVDYPSTAIAADAEATVGAWDRIKAGSVSDTSTVSSGSSAWQTWDGKEELSFLLSFPRGANTNMLRSGLNDFIKENFIYETLEVSNVFISGETVFLTINNFSKPEKAKEFLEFIKAKPDFFAGKGLFEYELAWITQTNFKMLISNNRINNYLDYFKGK
jgi:tetratricopeptide (TPR) repeat protein